MDMWENDQFEQEDLFSDSDDLLDFFNNQDEYSDNDSDIFESLKEFDCSSSDEEDLYDALFSME